MSTCCTAVSPTARHKRCGGGLGLMPLISLGMSYGVTTVQIVCCFGPRSTLYVKETLQKCNWHISETKTVNITREFVVI